jgi:prepilin-type N-terminal cleavage/methylation domain-containing protein
MKKNAAGGFTLIEVMVSVVIASIFFGAAAFFFATSFRQNQQTMDLQITMDEIQLFQSVLSRHVHSHGSINPSANHISFVSALKTASLTYIAEKNAIEYDPDGSVDGDEMLVLENSVISGFVASLNLSNNLVQVDVRLVEQGIGNLSKTNDYVFKANIRNK